jgi:hypothetical protein
MKKSAFAITMVSLTAIAAGCTTMSSQDYALVQKELRKPALRNEVTADCVASFRRDSAIEKENMAAFLNVSVAQLPSTFCTRFYRALASGRISYDQYLAAERNGNYAPFIRALRG